MPTEATPPMRGRKPKQPAPQASAQSAEQILRVPLTELHPFPNHPYGIREDQAMQDTVDSVKQNGVLVPAIVRPRAEGGYEIVAGHRRKLASERAGLPDMPCIVRNLSDGEAIIQLVDSNAQREDVLPSERAKAYKLRLEAVRRRAGRPRKEAADNDPLSENAPNVSAHFRSDDEVGTVDGVSGDTVRNIISLNSLVPELLRMVDEKKISLTPAYQIAALTEPEQRLLLETMDREQATPSVSQAQRMRKLSQAGALDGDAMLQIMAEQKKPQDFSLSLPVDKLRKYFPASYTPKKMEETIFKLLEQWHRRRQRTAER
ncbi:MAG: ParB/RepB/Spo0J family partition protein [Acidaminococcaceae bacterium]|nr:ParB/RepB/Spo0J family partition protein [Acidaminococcaceae bacterium]